MSDQHPTYAPPPSYAPPSGDVYGAPPAAPAGGQPPRSGNKKAVVIIAVIVGVLALCCCAGVVGASLFIANSETTVSEGAVEEAWTPSDEDQARVDEWLAWEPAVEGDVLPTVPAEKTPLVEEALAVIAPGFSYVDGVWWQGGLAEEEDWYYPDSFYVMARHDSSDDVWAAVEMYIEGDEMAPLDIDYTPDDGNVTAAVDGGNRVLEYWASWGASGFTVTPDDEGLWQTLGADWPGALVLDRHDDAGIATIDITTWPLYVHDASVPYVSTTYELADGVWELTGWEYVLPESDDTTI